MYYLSRCFFDPFQYKPANFHKNMPYSPELRQAVSQLAFFYTVPTPSLHLPYLCIFYNFPDWQIARGETWQKSRVSPEREYRGHRMGRVRACTAKNKILYIFHTHRSSQRGCGLFI